MSNSNYEASLMAAMLRAKTALCQAFRPILERTELSLLQWNVMPEVARGEPRPLTAVSRDCDALRVAPVHHRRRDAALRWQCHERRTANVMREQTVGLKVVVNSGRVDRVSVVAAKPQSLVFAPLRLRVTTRY